ncbi:hypothetical protein [Agromyces sp. SYSU T0242]|uniref:hypothetical protein n=1 Tax=Agromyces litoreus TaxID=3158561 RepID=UPI003393218B
MSVVIDAATCARAAVAALRASAARVRAAAAAAARPDLAAPVFAADALAFVLRVEDAAFELVEPVGAAAASPVGSPSAARSVPSAPVEALGVSAPFVVVRFFGALFAEAFLAESRLAAAPVAGRLAVDVVRRVPVVERDADDREPVDDAAGSTASAVGDASLAAASRAAAADARLAAVAFAAFDRAEEEELCADVVVLDLEAFFAAVLAALVRAAEASAALVRDPEPPPERFDRPPGRPFADAPDSPRSADTPVPVPSGVSSSAVARETEVTTTTYQRLRSGPRTCTVNSRRVVTSLGGRPTGSPHHDRTTDECNPQHEIPRSGIL